MDKRPFLQSNEFLLKCKWECQHTVRVSHNKALEEIDINRDVRRSGIYKMSDKIRDIFKAEGG